MWLPYISKVAINSKWSFKSSYNYKPVISFDKAERGAEEIFVIIPMAFIWVKADELQWDTESSICK